MRTKAVKCPACGGKDVLKVIYAGLPMKLCTDKTCVAIFGFWSCILLVIPFTGVFLSYEGSYWKAIFQWLSIK